ncbi:ABC transporter ATP-binding protein [Bacillus thuringiensis]|uniref:ABC transporter ATP-binding protein n=1 Tax=Bacillus thuringiensis TaxID=1428 RepID=UPI000CD92E7E|nr:ABC transporter ATP-binding protein [Bacillus thuringiensis]MCU4930818.1 ABC transporter ATP-binding protein/permease [Bacillus cereus]QFQ28800.1 ABC transporter ATP-binding protein [Bacillus thuringiensis]
MLEKLKQYKEDFHAVKWILKTISVEWKTAIIVLICIVITSILGPLSPLVLKEIIDNGLQGTSKYSLAVLLMAFGILPIIYGMCNVMLAYFSNKLSEKTTNILQLDMYNRVMDKSLNFFITNKSGQILQRVVREPGEINSYLSAITIQFASKIFLLITTLTTMFMLNTNLTIVSLLFVPLILLPGPFFSRWTVPIHIKAMDFRAEAVSKIQETMNMNGIFLIKTMGSQELESKQFNKSIKSISKYNIFSATLMEGVGALTSVLAVLAPIAVFWVASIEIKNGQVSIGTIVAFSTYLVQLADLTKILAGVWTKIPVFIKALKRLLEFRDNKDEIIFPDQGYKGKETKGSIELNNVSFSYNQKVSVLNNISFNVEPGKKIALVGESGGGKTTIVNLISRLCEPDSGEICIDGVNIKEFDRKTFTDLISYVPQEPFLFHMTVKENIAYGCGNVTESDIISAAKKAHIHDAIMDMDEGYNTLVGEKGFRLSTGQKQRIAIARIFLKNSKIVLLDEITSALDAFSENAIKEAIFNLLQERTAIIIAHRLSTIVECDEIYVLDQGEIIEQGNFNTLMKKNGKFKKLYDRQNEKIKINV